MVRLCVRIVALIRDVEPSGQSEDEFRNQVLKSAAVRFLVCVEVPCWLEAGEYSTRLMRRARHGSVEALETLLKIDKTVLLDPMIQRFYYRVAQGRDNWCCGCCRMGSVKASGTAYS